MKKTKRRNTRSVASYRAGALKAWRTKRRMKKARLEEDALGISTALGFTMAKREDRMQRRVRMFSNWPQRAVLDDVLPPVRTIDLIPKVEWP